MYAITKSKGFARSSIAMMMELDKSRYLVVTSEEIPPEYANSILRGHRRLVEEGVFGTLITQWLEKTGYNIYSTYYIIDEPLSFRVNGPFKFYYFPVENSPVVLPDGNELLKFSMPEGKVAFLEAASHMTHHIQFSPGIYKSIYITPTRAGSWIKRETHFWMILKQYRRML